MERRFEALRNPPMPIAAERRKMRDGCAVGLRTYGRLMRSSFSGAAGRAFAAQAQPGSIRHLTAEESYCIVSLLYQPFAPVR